jgi:hypothetical protein
LRMNPPKDGLQKLFEDDYAQAFTALTVIGLGLVGVAFLLRSVTWLWVIQIGLAVLSLLLPLSGFRRSWALLHELQVNVGLGAGVIIYLGALVGIIVLAANIKRPWREYQGRYGNQKT